jgi:hypothetical protein
MQTTEQTEVSLCNHILIPGLVALVETVRFAAISELSAQLLEWSETIGSLLHDSWGSPSVVLHTDVGDDHAATAIPVDIVPECSCRSLSDTD